jgi:hypothetical protein
MPVTGNETRIAEALLARLGALILTPAMPLQGPNLNYKPTNGTAYLRASILPRDTVEVAAIDTSSENDYGGVFQVDVFWPTNEGITNPLERASAVAAHFKRGTTMERAGVKVWVLRPPSVATPLQDKSWFQVPVSIPYRAFVPNP